MQSKDLPKKSDSPMKGIVTKKIFKNEKFSEKRLKEYQAIGFTVESEDEFCWTVVKASICPQCKNRTLVVSSFQEDGLKFDCHKCLNIECGYWG